MKIKILKILKQSFCFHLKTKRLPISDFLIEERCLRCNLCIIDYIFLTNVIIFHHRQTPWFNTSIKISSNNKSEIYNALSLNR